MSPDPRGLPADLVARARAVAAGDWTPPPARDAATVVLLRDAPGHGVEAYLLRRAAAMTFAAGIYVFPGGSVDPRDADARLRWSGPPAAQWGRLLTAEPPLLRALVCAAVRETFEESGILLAGPSAEEIADVSGAAWEAERLGLLDRSHSLGELLERHGFVLRADLLRPWAHWVTPELEPKRFDTRFFLAALPTGQTVREIGGEADRAAWLRPEQALEQQARGELQMLPPTAFTLAELAEFGCVADVLAAGSARDVRRVLPRVVVTEDDVRLLLPGDEGYGDQGSGDGRSRDERLRDGRSRDERSRDEGTG